MKIYRKIKEMRLLEISVACMKLVFDEDIEVNTNNHQERRQEEDESDTRRGQEDDNGRRRNDGSDRSSEGSKFD